MRLVTVGPLGDERPYQRAMFDDTPWLWVPTSSVAMGGQSVLGGTHTTIGTVSSALPVVGSAYTTARRAVYRSSTGAANMNAGIFQGFIEGWQFSTSYNQVSLTLYVSPVAYSLQAMNWSEVSVLEAWNTISGTLDWANALVVA